MEGHSPMNDPEVTVLIPYHTAREHNGMLARAIRSAQAQTVLCEILPAKDVHGMGAAVTRNHGLMLVRTPWVAFLDSDDELDPTHVARLLQCAKDTGADYVYPWFRVSGGLDPFPMFFGKPWSNDAPHHTTITVLVRTAIARKVGFITPDPATITGPNGTWGEDWHFTLGCMKEGAKIIHLPERTWTWHHHGKNSSGVAGQGDAK